MRVRIRILLIILLALMNQISPQCPTGYSTIPFGLSSYCVKCDTSCETCSGGNLNNCITCPEDFTFD